MDGRLGTSGKLHRCGLVLFTLPASVSQLPLFAGAPREQTACSPPHRGAFHAEASPDRLVCRPGAAQRGC